MKLLLDTNFMIDCVRFKIDFFKEIQKLEDFEGQVDVYVPLFCLDEVKKIVQTKKTGDAKLALDLLKDSKIKVVDATKTSSSVDSCLLNYAKSNQYAVATNDRVLAKKLKKNKIRVVKIRQRKFFEVF